MNLAALRNLNLSNVNQIWPTILLLPHLSVGWSCYICSPIALIKSAVFSRFEWKLGRFVDHNQALGYLVHEDKQNHCSSQTHFLIYNGINLVHNHAKTHFQSQKHQHQLTEIYLEIFTSISASIILYHTEVLIK